MFYKRSKYSKSVLKQSGDILHWTVSLTPTFNSLIQQSTNSGLCLSNHEYRSTKKRKEDDMFRNINKEEARWFKFYATTSKQQLRRLEEACDKILAQRLNLEQLMYFALVKMFCQEMIALIERE